MQEIASVGMTRGGEALTVDVAGLAAEHGHGKKSELREHMRQQEEAARMAQLNARYGRERAWRQKMAGSR